MAQFCARTRYTIQLVRFLLPVPARFCLLRATNAVNADISNHAIIVQAKLFLIRILTLLFDTFLSRGRSSSLCELGTLAKVSYFYPSVIRMQGPVGEQQFFFSAAKDFQAIRVDATSHQEAPYCLGAIP